MLQMMSSQIGKQLVSGVIAALLLALGAYGWQTMTAGGLIRFLGGATQDDLAELKTAFRGEVRSFEWTVGASVGGGGPHDAEPVEMIGEAAGVCYLAYISGRFDGYRESVAVYTEDGSWWLGRDPRVEPANPTKYVKARANCWEWPR